MVDKLVIYDSILFDIGHNVRRWAEAVCRRYTANAVMFAPVNKRVNKSDWYSEYPVGALKASISGDVERIGPKHLQTIIQVDVPYAIYVIGGTGPIFPSTAKKLRLPFNAGFAGVIDENTKFEDTLHNSVSGQAPNNFLMRAHDATAVRHPSLRRNSGAVFQEW